MSQFAGKLLTRMTKQASEANNVSSDHEETDNSPSYMKMSLAMPSIASGLLRRSVFTARKSAPVFTRHSSQTSSGTPLTESDKSQPAYQSGESSMVNHPASQDAQVRHNQPDYNAEVDQASSLFTPIPKRVMNGSEEGDVVAAAVLSGAPIELQARTVRIYRPTKTATQSGDWHGHHWRMDWDILGKGHRWENPLMGWQSSADFMQGTHVNFKSREDAIRFAEKQGYEYFVQEPNTRKFVPKAYANNFMHTSNKLKIVRTK